MSSCPKNNPFRKGGNCIPKCSKEEISSKTCEISNEIIKTQWLNNIIYFGERNYRYVNIETSENQNLLALVSSYPKNNYRLFYGITKEGNGYFKKNDKETQFYKMEINDINITGRFESEIFTFKFESSIDDKEYLLSYSKGFQFVEVYDFDKNIIYFDCIDSPFGEILNSHQIISPHFKLKGDSNSYLVGLIGTRYNVYGENLGDHIFLRKVVYNSLEIKKDPPEVQINEYQSCSKESLIFSCYQSKLNYIICFFKNDSDSYLINVYSDSLELLTYIQLLPPNEDNDIFFKCIHFFDEIGVFAYYSNNIKNQINFQFKQYFSHNNSICDYDISFPEIKIEDYSFHNSFTLNDIVKVFDKKFYFVSVSLDKESLYIISIYNYYEKEFSQRIYKINIYNLNNYKFYNDIRITIYKNFLALASNFNLGEDGSVFSSVMIFSYPNSSDSYFEISNYLFENNVKINNLLFKLKGECSMENNIFGYTYSGIQIIKNCNDETDIYLSFLSGEKIYNDYFLKNNEMIKLYIPKKNIYNSFKCQFKYACVVTEPEYEEYNNYTDSINDTSIDISFKEKNFFEMLKKNYVGKYSLYNIFLKNDLSENCHNYCELCYKDTPNICITCNDEYIIHDDGNKFCFCGFEDIIKNECKLDITLSQVGEVNLYIKNQLNKNNYTRSNIIIQTGNTNFQLSKIEDQILNNKNLSTIELGQCELELKNKNNIPQDSSLIIYKKDIKNFDKTATYVQFEVYNPNNFTKLDLSVCENSEINIYSPVSLDKPTISLYLNLNKSGYNLFDANDSFYNDVCSRYTSDNKTDLLLLDRKIDIYNISGNKALCQKGCKLVFYNVETEKVKCNCASITNYEENDLFYFIKSTKNDIAKNFFHHLSNSNFRLLKCYKYAFDFKEFFENIGRIIMALLIIGLIVFFIIYIFKDIKK